MPLITVSKGGPDTEIPDGLYSVTLVSIEGPKTVTARRGKLAGQDVDLLDWTFAIDEGPLANATIEASTSTRSGPSSRLYAFLTALYGGKAPAAGTQLEVGDLAGRQAIATVKTGEDGWPRIENLSAKYVPSAAPAAAPVAVPTPAAPAAAPQATPAREAVAAGQPNNDDLPF